jgi:hypothetical protein
MRARIRPIDQNASESWLDTCGWLISFQRSVSEAIRPVNQSDQVPGMIRAYLQLLERSNPDVCRRAGASGFFFRDGGDAVHSAIERMLAPWSRISTISSTVWKVMSSTFSAFRRSAFRRS